MTDFTGFPADGLSFLTTLGSSDKAWFDEHRSTYANQVVAPTKLFVQAMGEQLGAQMSPMIEAQPKANGSIAPINNDLRFAKDKSPYKDHLLLRFWEGPEKKVAPTLFLRISEDGVGFATGALFPDVNHWRDMIDAERTGVAFGAALAALGAGRDIDIAGDSLKRVPAPFDAEHPRGDLLKMKGIQARWQEPVPKKVIRSAAFVPWCTERLVACAGVHRWLVDHL